MRVLWSFQTTNSPSLSMSESKQEDEKGRQRERAACTQSLGQPPSLVPRLPRRWGPSEGCRSLGWNPGLSDTKTHTPPAAHPGGSLSEEPSPWLLTSPLLTLLFT